MIRQLKKQDVENFKLLCKEYKKNFLNLYDLNFLLNNKTDIIYIYEKSSKIVGFIFTEKTFEVLNIVHLYVKEKYRNLRIASQLIDFVLSDTSIEKSLLEVRVDNIPAINLYKKFGFKIIHTRKKYYNGIDGFVMEKKVQNEES